MEVVVSGPQAFLAVGISYDEEFTGDTGMIVF